jgi:MFS family permease
VLAQFAAPPLMPLLMARFGIDLAGASSLMSVFSVTGFLLALPAGLVLTRFGPLVTGAVALGSVVAGSVLGAVAPEYAVFLASRGIQGVGLGLIGVVAPSVVAAAFPPARRGLPMGIWATWVPVGGVVMYNVAPALGSAGGWQAAWWLAAVVAGLALAAYVGVLATCLPFTRTPSGPPAPSMGTALRNRDAWLLAATFGLFAVSSSGINTYLPTFLVAERGFDLAGAARLSSFVLVGAAVGSVLAGVASDRLGSRRLVYTAAAVGLAALLLLPFGVDSAWLPAVLLLVGLVSGAIQSAIFASVPEVMRDPRLAGAGMAAILFGQNGGFVAGPVVFGALVTATAWTTAGAIFAAVSLAGAAVGWRARVR